MIGLLLRCARQDLSESALCSVGIKVPASTIIITALDMSNKERQFYKRMKK